MKSEIIIEKFEKLEEKKKKFIKDGVEGVHVVADFDRTLTRAFEDGNKTMTTIAVLRNYHYINEEYSKKAHELFEHYHPIEIDANVPFDEKKKKIGEWWSRHIELLINSGLNKSHLERIVRENKILMRDGANEFFNILHGTKIPLVIFSANGVGDIIPMQLESMSSLYKNIYILSNLYKWNSNGNAVGFRKPIITSVNKDETALKDVPDIYKEIKDRKNILLLGDSLGDLGMVKGFDYDCLISVGFLNENIEENLQKYKDNFDVVITNDGDLEWVNDFLKSL